MRDIEAVQTEVCWECGCSFVLNEYSCPRVCCSCLQKALEKARASEDGEVQLRDGSFLRVEE